jgi:hypothetical protein
MPTATCPSAAAETQPSATAPDLAGALTVDYAVPLSKAAYDVVQPLRFSAGGF